MLAYETNPTTSTASVALVSANHTVSGNNLQSRHFTGSILPRGRAAALRDVQLSRTGSTYVEHIDYTADAPHTVSTCATQRRRDEDVWADLCFQFASCSSTLRP